MRVSILSLFTSTTLLVAAGCRTTEPPAKGGAPVAAPAAPAAVKAAPVSAIGLPVKPLLAAATNRGLPVRFFTKGGKESEVLPAEGGSVSIFHADGNGQDNYSFTADGVVSRQMRSVGADYTAGVWVPVP